MTDPVFFTTPLFLLMLIPLAAAGVYLMSRGGAAVRVPSTRFWVADSPILGQRRRWRRLPAWVTLALLSGMLATLAAGGPHVGGQRWRPVTLIVDRGITMSARDPTDTTLTRLQTARNKLTNNNRSAGAVVPDRVVAAPGGTIATGAGETSETPATDWKRAIDATDFAPDDSRSFVRQAVLEALRDSPYPVVVLTDAAFELDATRVIAVSPSAPGPNAGIVHVGADDPGSRLLVRVRANRAMHALVRATAGEGWVSQSVDLVPGEDAEVELDLSTAGPIIEARVEASGDVLPGDDAAWLVRRASWPRVFARSPLPAELRRLIEVYATERMPDARSHEVGVWASAPPRGPAVVVNAGMSGLTPIDVSGGIQIESHIGRDINWSDALADARVGPEPGADWRAIVRAGGRTLLAERDVPDRQVLVNFWSDSFPHTPDFVVLMGQVLDSFAGDEVGWTSGVVSDVPPEWALLTPAVPGLNPSPGVYHDTSGQLHAMNVSGVEWPAADASDWSARLGSLPVERTGARSLSGVLTGGALGLLGLSVVGWMRLPGPGSGARGVAPAGTA